MKTIKKLRRFMKTKRNHKMRKYNMKGGILTTNPEKDLINTHICNPKEGTIKDTPGQEVMTSISETVELTSNTVNYLVQEYQRKENNWFKFVIVKNDTAPHIFVINGAKTNKHSVCMLEGLLKVTQDNNEYDELRNAYNRLFSFKKKYSSHSIYNDTNLLQQMRSLIKTIDDLIARDIYCMPVMAAGSGTVMEDGTICINDKSGHYKPTKDSMELAHDVFSQITGLPVRITPKPDKNKLLELYGDRYEDYTGICL